MKYKDHMGGLQVVIFDIDGCISDDSWRLPYIKDSGSGRFDQYHSMAESDKPLGHGAARLLEHIKYGHFIYFMTARPASVEVITISWIKRHFPQIKTINWALRMRKASEEGVNSVDLKRSMLRSSMHDAQRAYFAYDDRPDVVEMYLQEGIAGARILDAHGCDEFVGQETRISYREADRIEFDGAMPGLRKQAEKFGSVDLSKELQVGGLYPPMLKGSTSTPSGAWSAPSTDKILADVEQAKDDIRAEKTTQTAADILEEAGRTFRERNAVYKDNAEVVGKVMAALFPNGVKLRTAEDHKMYHLFELVIVKLTRFTQSGLTHTDSIHDLAVYAAMCENLAATHKIDFN